MAKNLTNSPIEHYIKNHGDELKINGYQLLKGEILNKFKRLAYGTFIDEGTITSILGVFNFRVILNFAMSVPVFRQFILSFKGKESIILTNTPTKPLPEAQIGGFFYACCFSLDGRI